MRRYNRKCVDIALVQKRRSASRHHPVSREIDDLARLPPCAIFSCKEAIDQYLECLTGFVAEFVLTVEDTVGFLKMAARGRIGRRQKCASVGPRTGEKCPQITFQIPNAIAQILMIAYQMAEMVYDRGYVSMR
jgi:hypothetical protein